MYPAVCSLAGLVAGMFGVGGGIVKVALLSQLRLGICVLLRMLSRES